MTGSEVDKLRAWLEGGAAGAAEGDEVRRVLGLDPAAEDREVARGLVRETAHAHVEAVESRRDAKRDPREVESAAPVSAADSTFLGRLGSRTDPEGSDVAIEAIADVRTLLAVLRAGTLPQRRAAIARLAQLLSESKGISSDQARDGLETLRHGRDVEIAYERAIAREKMSGAVGRAARGERDEWRKIVDKVVPEIASFWDSERADEPIWDLPGEERMALLMRVRDLPHRVADHLCAVIEGTDGVSDRSRRLAVLSSLRYAGDRRLVPSLRAVLEGSEPELVQEAARVLARIDDPRVRPALLATYDRTVVDVQRAVLAGALGAAGDLRGADYARHLLENEDAGVLVAALEAMATLGGPEDGDKVAALTDHDDPRVVSEAIRTLARIGDGRVLAQLSRLRDRTMVSAMWAEIEDAELAIRARMELRGEEHDISQRTALERASRVALAQKSDPALVKMASWKDWAIGQLWLFFGAVERAVGRFEAAAARREGWALPLVAIALAYARRGKHAQALPAFRRAIEADRERVEANPMVVRAMARSFLRRAEEVERDGRVDIARGLLDEVLSIDLRRAGSALRFELERRRDPLRHRGA